MASDLPDRRLTGQYRDARGLEAGLPFASADVSRRGAAIGITNWG